MHERAFFSGVCLSIAAVVGCGQAPALTVDGTQGEPGDLPPDTSGETVSIDAGLAADAAAPGTVRPASPGGDAATPVARADGGSEGEPDGSLAEGAPEGGAGEGSGGGASAPRPQNTGAVTGGAATLGGVGVVHQSVSSAGCHVPWEAQLEDTSRPTTVVGNGTPGSCTSRAFVEAVRRGGVVTFDCGPDPVTIPLDETAIIPNAVTKLVIDGGGRVALSGRGGRRILYQNTCDGNLGITTSHCDNQDHPQLTVQNLTLRDGNARGAGGEAGGGGGAIYAQGGRLKIVNSYFENNQCDDVGEDVGGGAVRAFMQHNGQPIYVVNSSFQNNQCSNGGALSSIGVSYTIVGSSFRQNRAIGFGANPAEPGTPGGGSGGAIYNDGHTFTLNVCGSTLENNHAREGGGAIFFVSNDRSGTLHVDRSVVQNNPSEGFETDGYPGMFVIARSATWAR